MYYKSVEYISLFQQKKLNIGLTLRRPNGVRINPDNVFSSSFFIPLRYIAHVSA